MSLTKKVRRTYSYPHVFLDGCKQCPCIVLTAPSGIPVSNQALLFAGRHLGPDSALLLDELQLDSYSLAHEVGGENQTTRHRLSAHE